MEEENQTKEKEVVKKIRCPSCNSSFTYFKLKDNAWQCRNCGNKFSNENKEEKVEE